MKKITFVLLAIFTIFIAWLAGTLMAVHKAKNRAGILLSPDKSKSVEIIDWGSNSQAFMNFHKRFIVAGSNITSGDFKENEIVMEWRDNKTLIIKHPKGTAFRNKEEELYFIGELTKIEYQELSSN